MLLGRLLSSHAVPAGAIAGVCLALLFAVGGCSKPVSPEQFEAMTTVRAAGGKVFYDKGGYRVDLESCPIDDDELAKLSAIEELRSINLEGTRITDKGLRHLESIPTLEEVRLQRSAVSPEGVEQLKKAMPKLEVQY